MTGLVVRRVAWTVAIALLFLALVEPLKRPPPRQAATYAAALAATGTTSAADDAIPVDGLARAKFPRSPGVMIDALADINRTVNAAITPIADKDHYGINELWVMFPEDHAGDCEDFALTKLGLLANAGFPVVANTKIVGVAVKVGDDYFGHAILAVRLAHGEVAYLDNRFAQLMTRRDLVRAGYHFFDWRA
jgi:predicted transglutaminase-like cysteine proteinase